MKLTDEQQAILEFIRSGKGNLLIDALAGCAKTSTILESLRVLPQKSALLCAFNKRIADELVERMPPVPKGAVWKAQTFHSAGLKILSSYKRFEIDDKATENLVNDAAAKLSEEHEKDKKVFKLSFQARRAAVRLLRTLKETQVERELSVQRIAIVGYDYDLFNKIGENEIKQAVDTVRIAYELSQNITSRTSIDFCDMTWLPVVLDLKPPSRYQIVYVDEAQDLSLPQLKLVQSLVATNGRLVAVGDLQQAIYGWRGAIGTHVWNELLTKHNATKLPLTTTFRCAVSIVEEAQKLVPDLQPREDAPIGSVSTIPFGELADELRESWDVDTFLLSRTNADLLQAALYLWKSHVSFSLVAGKEIVEPLYDIIDRLDKSTKDRFRSSLTNWMQVEMHRAESAHAAAWADRIEQQYGMLSVMLEYAEPIQFKSILADILEATASAISLSTVHKAKGLEASRVYLLKETFARFKPNRKAPPSQEDLNIEYVAITRAKEDLIWVTMPEGLDVLSRLHDLGKRAAIDRQIEL